jgi:hypothetical protein
VFIEGTAQAIGEGEVEFDSLDKARACISRILLCHRVMIYLVGRLLADKSGLGLDLEQ